MAVRASLALQNLPSEEAEQVAFVQWLELKGLPFTAIPNSTYTTSWKVKARNKRMGVRPGLADMLVVIPHVGVVFIELKRKKRGVVSEHQKQWLEVLNTVPGVACHIARGCDEAIGIIESYLPSPARGITQKVTSDMF